MNEVDAALEWVDSGPTVVGARHVIALAGAARTRLPRPDFDRAARIYIESPEAQHGDLELARWDAELWWGIFREAAAQERLDALEEE